MISYMKGRGVQCVFHYIPLHSSEAGRQFGRFSGEDVYTTKESERLMRLPLFYNLTDEEMRYVAQCILEYPGFS
jgi:dTDP-4-amino-4,6-dideoxygalactose transaminase